MRVPGRHAHLPVHGGAGAHARATAARRRAAARPVPPPLHPTRNNTKKTQALPAQARRARHVACPRGAEGGPHHPRRRRPAASHCSGGGSHAVPEPTRPGPAPPRCSQGSPLRAAAVSSGHGLCRPPIPPTPLPPRCRSSAPDLSPQHSATAATSPSHHHPSRGVRAWLRGRGRVE